MLRARHAARSLRTVLSTRAASGEAAAATKTPAPVSAPAFSEVKFVKEDVEAVMAELPAYNFYEFKESEVNPYKDSTLDRSILLDNPEPKLVKPQVQFSQLENGMKVASIDKQGLTARLGLFVNAGSRFESASNFGVSHMAAMMGYNSTAHLSHLRTVKTLEQLGANSTASCTAGREEIAYKVDVMREFMPLVVPLMVGNVLFPRLLPWEVKAAHKQVAEARSAQDADAIVSELLHKAAFCNNTLGFSTLASDRSMPYFTPETIRSFMLDHFAPERMVLVGVNVDHAEFSKWAMRSFADYNAIPLKKRTNEPAQYTGGDLRAEGPSPFCHVAIGLQSAAWGEKDLAAFTVLQTVLGGGSAVSSNPGSGVTSRLATQVVKQNPYVESCAAFNTSYSDSGLFGVYGVSHPDKAGEMVSGIAKTITSLKSVSGEELARAKAVLKGNLHRQLDDDTVLMQDIGTQLLTSGRYSSVSDFARAIDGVNESAVSSAANKLLASKPTVAAYGDTHSVPHLSAVEALLKA